jgi:RNA polymerase sigma factor (sigma-70 family)
MRSGANQTGVIHYLRAQAGGALTDGELLARYVQGRDEAAFTAVVQRYGGLVLGVARRHLADPQQAEDVFQATFLALARSAASLSRQAPVAGWLYTVALRQARKARVRDARRRDCEADGARPPTPPADPLAEVSGRELLRAVDEELGRLPEKFRLPVLLCCVQGLSREEAARQLGWSAGAVKGRLERGRRRLAARLTRRGLAPAALVLAPLAAAAVPADLLASAAALGATPWSRAVPSAVLALAAGVRPRRPFLVLALCGSLLAAGLAGLAFGPGQGGSPQAAPPPRAAQAPAARPDEPLPAGSTLRLGTSLYRHGIVIQSLSVSADGKVAVVGSGGHVHGAVCVYDLTTGRRRYTVPVEVPHSNEAVALSPDGRTLASDDSGTITLYDAATGAKVRTLATPKANTRTLTSWLLWSPDGKALAVATPDGRGILLLDPERGTVTRTLTHQNVVYAAAFSPDGKRLAAGGYDSTGGKYFGRIWEVATGKELRRFDNDRAALRTLAFSPDGKTIAGGGDDGRLRLWDADTGQLRRAFDPNGGRIRSVAFAPNGQTVAAAGASVRLYDPATGKERLRIDRKALGLHFTADGKILTAAVAGTIERWDTATGRTLTPQEAGDSAVDQILVTPDGRRVLTRGQEGEAHLWDTRTGAHLRRIEVAWQCRMALSPDGRYLVWPVTDEGVRFTDPREPNTIYFGSRLRLYDLDAGRFVERFPGFKGNTHDLAFTPDGKSLLTVDRRDGAVRLWDVARGKERRSFRAVRDEARQSYQVWHPALSPDGRTLAVTYQAEGRGAFSSFAVRLWDVATGKEAHELPGHFRYVEALAFSPDSRLLVTGCEPLAKFAQKMLKRPVNQVFVWEVASGRRPTNLPDGLPVGAVCAAFAPDGRTAATAAPDGTIRLWEVKTWKVRTEFRGHRGRVCALAFLPDGRLLSGGLDTTVLVWDVRPPRAAPAR